MSQNFERVFLETTFFELAVRISRVLMDRFTSNLERMFFIHPFIVWTLPKTITFHLVFLKNSELLKKYAKKKIFF